MAKKLLSIPFILIFAFLFIVQPAYADEIEEQPVASAITDVSNETSVEAAGGNAVVGDVEEQLPQATLDEALEGEVSKTQVQTSNESDGLGVSQVLRNTHEAPVLRNQNQEETAIIIEYWVDGQKIEEDRFSAVGTAEDVFAEYEASSAKFSSYCSTYHLSDPGYVGTRAYYFFVSDWQEPEVYSDQIDLSYVVDDVEQWHGDFRASAIDMTENDSVESVLDKFETIDNTHSQYSQIYYFLERAINGRTATYRYSTSNPNQPVQPSGDFVHVYYYINGEAASYDYFKPADVGMTDEDAIEDVVAQYEAVSDLFWDYSQRLTLVDKTVFGATVSYFFKSPAKTVTVYVQYAVNGNTVGDYDSEKYKLKAFEDVITVTDITDAGLRATLITKLIELHPWLEKFIYEHPGYSATGQEWASTGTLNENDKLQALIESRIVRGIKEQDKKTDSGYVFVDSDYNEFAITYEGIKALPFETDFSNAPYAHVTIPFESSVGPYKLQIRIGAFQYIYSSKDKWTDEAVEEFIDDLKEKGYTIEVDSYEIDGAVCKLHCSDFAIPDVETINTVKSKIFVDGVLRTSDVQWFWPSDNNFSSDTAIDIVKKSPAYIYYADRFDLESVEFAGHEGREDSWVVEAHFKTRDVSMVYKLFLNVYVDGELVETKIEYIDDDARVEQIYLKQVDENWLSEYVWFGEYADKYDFVELVEVFEGKIFLSIDLYFKSIPEPVIEPDPEPVIEPEPVVEPAPSPAPKVEQKPVSKPAIPRAGDFSLVPLGIVLIVSGAVCLACLVRRRFK